MPRLAHLWQGSLRRQLILAVAGVHALLMSLFIWDVTTRQQQQLLDLQAEQAQAMVHAMATSSAGWLAARDVAGLQEIVEAQRRYPELSFAMLLDLQGLVLAHTDHARVGQYVQDLPDAGIHAVFSRTPQLVDVVTPVMLSGRQVGWGRVGIGQRVASAQLARNTRDGILYALAAIGIGVVFASVMGTRLTAKLYAIRGVSAAVRSGRRDARVPELGPDETGRLGRDFNEMLDVLDSQQTEIRLQSAALEAAANMVMITGLDGRIRWVNPAFSALTGYTKAEALGKRPGDLLRSGQHSAAFYREMWTTILAGNVWRGEFINRRRDGSLYPDNTTIAPLKDSRGTVTNFIAIKEDITARRQAEKALRDSEEKYRTLIQKLQSGVVVHTADTRIVTCNPVAQTLLGLTEAQLLGKTAIDPDWHFFREDGTTLAPKEYPVSRVLATRQPLRNLVLGVHRPRDNRELWVMVNANPVLDQSGAIAEIIVTFIDITEHKRAEEALRESEQRFRQVTENIDEVFWLTDAEKKQMIYISPAYHRVWGRTCESLYADPLSWLEAVHTEDQERVRNAMQSQQTAGTYNLEYRILRTDGEQRWIHDRAFPIKDADGQVRRIAGVAEDISEAKRLERQFLHAQRMEAIGTLAGGVAHDLNNILAPILMSTSLLRDKLADPHDREILTMVEQGAQRGASIVRQLLTFSRGIEGTKVSVQPRHLLKEMAQIMHETFPRNIVIQERLSTELRNVVADATQLHQVLMNLCVNARDAMPRGGTLTLEGSNIELSEAEVRNHAPAKPGPYVMIIVSDTGHGIPSAIIDRIFDPFFTTKGVGHGTGLGLPTVMGIVKSHGGFLSVYSEPDRGSVFKVFLPADREGVEAQPAILAESEPAGHNELILVVDDEMMICETISRILVKQGYRVITAGNGVEALRLFVQHRASIRLVLTDVMMPVMGGVELIQSLRRLEPAIRIVASSGLDQGSRRPELMALGVREILSKPFVALQLLQTVERALA